MRFLLRLTSPPPAVVYVRSKKRDKISNGRQKRLSKQSSWRRCRSVNGLKSNNKFKSSRWSLQWPWEIDWAFQNKAASFLTGSHKTTRSLCYGPKYTFS